MTTYAVGSLVAARGREWVVLPDSTDDFLVLRPLGGTDDDVAGVLPAIEPVAPASFPPPTRSNEPDWPGGLALDGKPRKLSLLHWRPSNSAASMLCWSTMPR